MPHGTSRAFAGRIGGIRTAREEANLSRLLRALGAGYGAKKLGGGCISTILIFLLLYWLLGVLF